LFGRRTAIWGIVPECDSLALNEEAPAMVYDLEERTARFGETIIRFANRIPHSPVNNRLIDQLVGAGTSVGANYCEADDGVSKPDFSTASVLAGRKRGKPNSFYAWLRWLNRT
jgi:hypothetical protein